MTCVLAFHWFNGGLFGGVLCVSLINPFLSIPGIQISTIIEPCISFCNFDNICLNGSRQALGILESA